MEDHPMDNAGGEPISPRRIQLLKKLAELEAQRPAPLEPLREALAQAERTRDTISGRRSRREWRDLPRNHPENLEYDTVEEVVWEAHEAFFRTSREHQEFARTTQPIIDRIRLWLEGRSPTNPIDDDLI